MATQKSWRGLGSKAEARENAQANKATLRSNILGTPFIIFEVIDLSMYVCYVLILAVRINVALEDAYL